MAKPVKINYVSKCDAKIAVKLSLDLDKLDQYPPSVTNYYRSKKKWFKELTGFQNSPFPHEDTSDLAYDKNQFSAYRDLGYFIVTHYLNR